MSSPRAPTSKPMREASARSLASSSPRTGRKPISAVPPAPGGPAAGPPAPGFLRKQATKKPSASKAWGQARRKPSPSPAPGAPSSSRTSRQLAAASSARKLRQSSSFSRLLSVQVAYTRQPPGLSARQPLSSSPRCSSSRPRRPSAWSGAAQRSSGAGSLRRRPSAEQGASTSTASKDPGARSPRLRPSRPTARKLATPARRRFVRSGRARSGLGSLATRRPLPPSQAPSCVALLPGAAQRSSTRRPSPSGARGPPRSAAALSTSTGSMDVASWT
mmetsp:Transcript_1254/g.3890  ORF Transcript_1254/g.3890 Transcript_1254/m.3890 type:complete len:275 (+) Transcript_1254:142-966(+)